MSEGWKPEGYTSVSVYIVAQGAQKVIDLLKKTFGATELRRFDTPEGKIMHAEVRIGDTVVMIADASGEHPAFPVSMHVYVEDVNATYQKALAAGGLDEQKHMVDRDAGRRGDTELIGTKFWHGLAQSLVRRSRKSLLLLAPLCAAACGGGGASNPPPAPLTISLQSS